MKSVLVAIAIAVYESGLKMLTIDVPKVSCRLLCSEVVVWFEVVGDAEMM